MGSTKEAHPDDVCFSQWLLSFLFKINLNSLQNPVCVLYA